MPKRAGIGNMVNMNEGKTEGIGSNLDDRKSTKLRTNTSEYYMTTYDRMGERE